MSPLEDDGKGSSSQDPIGPRSVSRVNLGVLVLLVIGTLAFWRYLPDQLPIRFDLSGEAQIYAAKPVALAVLPGVMITLYLLLTRVRALPALLISGLLCLGVASQLFFVLLPGLGVEQSFWIGLAVVGGGMAIFDVAVVLWLVQRHEAKQAAKQG